MPSIDVLPPVLTPSRSNAAPSDVPDWPGWCAGVAPVGLLRVEGGTVVQVNRVAADLMNADAADLRGTRLQRWISTPDIVPLLHAAAADRGASVRALLKGNDDTDTAPLSVELRAAPAPGGLGNAWVVTLESVADGARAVVDGSIVSHSSTRHEEGRGAFVRRLASVIALATRHGSIFGLLVLQIDQLQLVKETFGYAGGDALIEAVRRRLAGSGGDMLVHLGNGEFATELQGLSSPPEAAAQKAAQRLVQALTAPFMVDTQEVHLSCSIGAALFPFDGNDGTLLLDRAQAAMRQAHGWGKNHVFFHSPEASVMATSRLARESALRHALERGEMYVSYQPQIDLYSGRIVGLEALARWRHSEQGEISPAEFIPLAEQAGLIVGIGEWVLRQACEQGVRWREAGLIPVRIGVNLSMKQLELPDMAARVRAILAETGFAAHQLGLEITESMLFDNLERVASTLAELRADGIEIALDDFGTGYSNLGYLSKLPIDVLKIDRAFVPDVTTAPEDVSIARAMIKLAHSLHMTVLAEGVETAGQLAMLVAGGCDQVQGYFFSRPVSPEAVAVMLRDGLPTLGAPYRRRSSADRVVLVVDGDAVQREICCRELVCVSDEVLVAADGRDALRLLAEHDVGVILAAHLLPDMSGMDLLGRAKALYPAAMRIATVAAAPAPSLDEAVNGAAVFRIVALPTERSRLRADVDDAFRHGGVRGQQQHTGAQTLWQSMSGELIELQQRFDGSSVG